MAISAEHSLPPEPLFEVGRFFVERELGRGGFGIVYLAFDPLLNRSVALKIPRLGALTSPELRRRFLKEAEIAATLEHPAVVPVYEAGEAGASMYIVSAYCSGPNLADWFTERGATCDPRLATSIIRRLAEALQYCHERGVLHRDLKPANIMLSPSPGDELGFIPRITDFGLAKLMESSLTDTGSSVLLGSPLYMAPEQAHSRVEEIGPTTDVYALGAIFYELLTGRPPFNGIGLAQVLDQVRSEEPARLSRYNRTLPRALEIICLKCLRKAPEQRYATAQELAEDLDRYVAGQPIRAKPTTLLEKVGAWSRRPERIPQAGLTAILIALVAVGPILGGLAMIGSGRFEFPDPLAAVFGLLKIFVCFCVPHFLLGYFTLANHRLALWAGVLAPPLLLLYVTGIIFGFLDTGGYLANPESDQTVILSLEMVGVVLLAVEFMMYAAALTASYDQARSLAMTTPPAAEKVRIR